MCCVCCDCVRVLLLFVCYMVVVVFVVVVCSFVLCVFVCWCLFVLVCLLCFLGASLKANAQQILAGYTYPRFVKDFGLRSQI
jgi:hypothetical protein